MAKDTDKQRDYVSYLLRMWQDSGDVRTHPPKEALWRASLQSPLTGERIGFRDLELLFAYLRAQIGAEYTVRADQRKEQNEKEQQELS
jgi:hypothetical protein